MVTVPLLTAPQLQTICPELKPKAVELYIPYFNSYFPKFNITTTQRIASFLSEVLHESEYLKFMFEIWGPTEQQRKYERDFNQPWHSNLSHADRNYLAFMLGNEHAGDGKFFKGRCPLMITGRSNYSACSLALFGDTKLVYHPELLETPEHGIKACMWYWDKRGLNRAADTPGIKDDRKLVNGGSIGLNNVQRIYDNAIKVLAA